MGIASLFLGGAIAFSIFFGISYLIGRFIGYLFDKREPKDYKDQELSEEEILEV